MNISRIYQGSERHISLYYKEFNGLYIELSREGETKWLKYIQKKKVKKKFIYFI